MTVGVSSLPYLYLFLQCFGGGSIPQPDRPLTGHHGLLRPWSSCLGHSQDKLSPLLASPNIGNADSFAKEPALLRTKPKSAGADPVKNNTLCDWLNAPRAHCRDFFSKAQSWCQPHPGSDGDRFLRLVSDSCRQTLKGVGACIALTQPQVCAKHLLSIGNRSPPLAFFRTRIVLA